MKKKFTIGVAALAGGSVLAVAGTAAAQQQTCAINATGGDAGTPEAGSNGQTIGDANTVFITGSSAIQPLLAHLASVLYQEAAAAAAAAEAAGVGEAGTEAGTSRSAAVDLSQVVKIVYQSTASCQGVNDITTTMPESASAVYMDGSAMPTATLVPCTNFSGAGGTLTIDIGASDVYPTSCGVTVPASMKDWDQGAIQVMEIAVPSASTESSITADAAYVVFGWGGQTYQVGPWTDYTQIWIRPNGFLASGTETMIGSAIGLVTTNWLQAEGDAGANQIQQGSGNVYSHLVSSTNPNATIGILSAEFLDKNRGAVVLNSSGVAASGGVKPLAFQAYGQECAYYADSSALTYDKMNVRQGRYAIWGAHHWITTVDPSGNPVGLNGNSAAVASVINHLMHASSLPAQYEQQMLVAEAQTYDVPSCAMQVSRTGEVTSTGSGEMSYVPPKGCGCFFEASLLGQNGTPISSYCTPCTVSADAGAGAGADAGVCPAAYPSCNYGFCEVQ